MKNQLLILSVFIFFLSCQNKKVNEGQIAAEPHTGHNALTPAEKEAGWQLLFDGQSTEQWRGYQKDSFPAKGWGVEDGVLMVRKGGGDIITKAQFGNFELSVDFAVTDSANSGIFYLAIEEPEMAIWQNAPEFQILDNQTYVEMYGDMTTHLTGDNYDLHSAPEDYTLPVGEWNTARISHQNGQVEHRLNGHKTIEYDIGSPEWEALVQKSKFAEYPNYGRAKRGHIGLQEHGHLVKFRNIKIREL